MAHDVFISYSRSDVKIADSICQAFDQAGISYWIDRGGITSGEAFHAVIVNAIKDSKITVFISSVNSNMSEYTIKEIVIAFKRKKHIIPFCIDEEPYADKLEFYLCDLDQLAYYMEKEFAIQKLVKDIQNLLGIKPENTKRINEENISATNEENPVFQNYYEMGKQALLKFDLNSAFYDLLEPALHKYKDSQELFAQLIENRTRIWKIDDEKFEQVLKYADEGNAFAQYIISKYYRLKKNDSLQAFEYAKKSAEQNDSYGIFELAGCYDLGIGIERDNHKNNELTRKSIALNNYFAMLYAAKDNLYGWSGKKYLERGISLLKKAVEFNYPSAIALLAEQHWEGISVPKDFEQAENLIKKAILLGYIEGYEILGNFYMYEPVSFNLKDTTKGVEYYMKGAEYDEPNCLSAIAMCYFYGNAVKKDVPNAIKWFTRAANAGDRYAYFRLGYIYYYGNEVESNEALAWKYFKKGEKMMDSGCSYMLGIICLDGYAQEGQEKKNAVHYFEESANLGGNYGEESMIKLFDIYTKGELVEKNERKALEWLKKAAELNNSTALLKYGVILTDMDSPYSDEFKGVKYLNQALEQNNFEAAYQLGFLYRKGIGVNENKEKAKEMFFLAAEKAEHAQAHCDYAKMHCHILLHEWDEPLVEASAEQVEKDHNLAQNYFEKAAELNLDEALARMYEMNMNKYANSGYTDETLASYCFKYASSAAEKEHPLGLLALGTCYKNGVGNPISAEKAIEYFKKAHDKKNKSASYLIAEIYNDGKITPRDIAKAKYWYEESLKSGNTDAKEKLKKVHWEETVEISNWETSPNFNKIDEYVALVFNEAEDKNNEDAKIKKLLQPYIDLTKSKSITIDDLELSVQKFHAAWENLLDAAKNLRLEIPLTVLKASDMFPRLSFLQIKSIRKELAILWLHLKQKYSVLQEANLTMLEEILDIAERHTDEDFQILLVSIVECKFELEGVELENGKLFLQLEAIDIEKEINTYGKNNHEHILELADEFYQKGNYDKHYYVIAQELYKQATGETIAKERLLEIEKVGF